MKELNTFRQFLSEEQTNEGENALQKAMDYVTSNSTQTPIESAAKLSAYYGKNLTIDKIKNSHNFALLPGNTDEEKFDYLIQTIKYHEGEGAQKLKTQMNALTKNPTYNYFAALDMAHQYYSGGYGGGSFADVMDMISKK